MRFLQPFDHLQPIWYYAPILVGGLLPGTILLVGVLRGRLLRGESDRGAIRGRLRPAGSGFSPALWCVFFFSCSGSKLPTYILPAYPFLCLALGEFVARTRWNTADLHARDGRRDGGARAVRRITTACRGTRRSARRSADRNSSSGSWTTPRRRSFASRGTATRWRSTRDRDGHAERADEGREPDDRRLPPPAANGDPVHASRLARRLQADAAAESGDRGDDDA